MKLSKGSLAIRLSRLKGFQSVKNGSWKQKVRDEQYVIDAEIAASVLWDAFQIGDIKGKVIADLGCGTGILGIGALLLGAKEVYFVEKDIEALEIARENLKSEGLLECGMQSAECGMTNDECGMTSVEYRVKGNSLGSDGNMDLGTMGIARFFNIDIGDFDKKVDTVIMNPPFGTKRRHADREFLEKACKIAKIVYSLHKSETLGYIEGFLAKEGFKISRKWDFLFPLKASQRFHKRRIYRFRVSCVRTIKSSLEEANT